ncbi:MAG: hypothetical protein GXC72_00695 [Chitinophagaceae bacterium]|nr:hypothetical protein [Chitinophagaceae bacterium]
MNIENLSHACEIMNLDSAALFAPIQGIDERYRDAVSAFLETLVLTDAANIDPETKERWVPDYNNSKERKWTNWFDLEVHPKNNPSGFRFYDSVCVNAYAIAVGAGLCFKDSSTARFMGEKHQNVYKRWLSFVKPVGK